MKKVKIFIISILTVFSLYAESILKEITLTLDKVDTISLNTFISGFRTNSDYLLITILGIALIIFYTKYQKTPKRKPFNIISVLFSALLVFGFSYNTVGSSALVTGNIFLGILSIIKFITYYYFLSTTINLIYIKTKDINLTKLKLPKKLEKFKNYYELHPYKTSLIVILIAWLPYIISFYPAILSPDPSNQIKQYYNLETHYITGVNLIDENVLITNHHPVFHTFILGGFTKIGDMLGSLNFGLFLFTCFQIFVVISAMIYTLTYLKKLKVPFIYRFIILLMFSFVPVFPLYAISSVKDTLFGALLVFYIIEIHKLLTNKYTKKEYLILALLLLIIMLVRNNAIYILMLSMLVLIILIKEKRLPLLLVLILSIGLYQAHNKILLPAMHISMGSVREMLSVPFQQTARYTKYYGNELTEEEKNIIDKILTYDTLASRYKPHIADPVKNAFNKDATTEDLKNYFEVWFACLLNHPGVYIDATINTTYGYFYPNTSKWYVYYNYDERLIKSGLDYHYNSLTIPRSILSSFASVYPYIPILGAQVNIGLNIWIYIYLLAYLIIENKKKYIALLIPAFALLLTCVVGPVNTYFRYMFPLVLSLPLILGIIYQETSNKQKKLTKKIN